jgi:hypothetical protein
MSKKLSSDVVINVVNNIESGRFFRICYESEVPLNAATKKQKNVHISKVVETTARTGVEYNNIERVIERKETKSDDAPVRAWTNNYEWVIPNKVKYNSNTKKNYLQIAPITKGGNTKVKYVISTDGNDIEVDPSNFESVAKDYVIPSYFNKRGDVPEVMTINCENIVRIDNVVAD